MSHFTKTQMTVWYIVLSVLFQGFYIWLASIYDYMIFVRNSRTYRHDIWLASIYDYMILYGTLTSFFFMNLHYVICVCWLIYSGCAITKLVNTILTSLQDGGHIELVHGATNFAGNHMVPFLKLTVRPWKM